MDQSELHALKAELHRMQRRVDELEQGDHASTVSRRHMLRGIGAAAVGAAAGGLAFTHTASATNGQPINIGASQTATSHTMLVPTTGYSETSPGVGAFTVSNDDAFADSNAPHSCIAAFADDNAGTGHSIGVFAKAKTDTVGVSAIAAKLDAPVPLQLIDTAGTGAPSSSVGGVGQFVVDGGDLWFCVDQKPVGMTQVYTWRKMSGLGVAGSYHPVTPRRVYDSRKAQGLLSAGQHRDVSVKDAIDPGTGEVSLGDFIPPGATAVMANVTITNTVGHGFLACNPGLDYTIRASTVNWMTPNQVIANGITLTLNDNRQIALIVNGSGAKTQVILDVLGYYL
jgi:hypothetical protein